MNYELPKRYFDIYTKIEEFEKYAYTHSIAYELARRNTYVEKSLNFLFELFLYLDQTILPILAKYEKTTITNDMLEAIHGVENIYKEFLIGLLNHYNKKQFLDDFESLKLENIKEKIAYVVKDITKELYDQYYIIYQHESEKFTSDFNEIYTPLIYLERDKALTEHIHNLSKDEINIDDYYKYNYAINEYFTIYQSIYKNQKDFSFSTIYPNFRTAMRDFTDTKIVLNLNFSKDEILDYVKKIKDDYDNKNSIIKSPRQLLEEDLVIHGYDTDSVHTAGWADLFFIYDYYHFCESYTNKKVYKIQEEILIELTKYHGLKIKKNGNEIKNKKDSKFKQVSLEDYNKDTLETNEENIYFDTQEGIKPYLTTKAIEYKYKRIKNYIEGENPNYKTLLHRFPL